MAYLMFDIGLEEHPLGINEEEAAQLSRWLDERALQSDNRAFAWLSERIESADRRDAYGSAAPVVLSEHEQEMMLSVLKEQTEAKEMLENPRLPPLRERLATLQRERQTPKENTD